MIEHPAKKKKRGMIRAAIYIRYSSVKQQGNFSVEYQHDECMKYIERKGYKFIKRYVDEAQSGKKTAGREAFHEVVRDAERGDFDVIVVFSFSRSFRNTRDALNYIMDMQEKSSVKWESVIEPIDMSNPHGKFSGTNLFAMHELQADIIAAHVKSGMYIAAQQGYYLGGFVPYGYELYGTNEFARGKERKKYQPHPKESIDVMRMFQMYADGYSLTAIQEDAKKRGIKGRRGDVMGDQTIARILKNEFYIGTREYKIKGYEPIYIKNAVPAIIPPELWARVQTRHASQSPKPRRTKRLYSLTGKIYCGKCGAHMFGVYKGDKRSDKWSHAYYHCSSKKSKRTCDMKNVRKDRIDAYCMAQIKKHILNPDKIAELAAQIAKLAGNTPEKAKAELKSYRTRRTQLAGYLKNMARKEIEEGYLNDIQQELKSEYTSEIAEVDIKIVQLEAAEQNAVSESSVAEYLTNMFDQIENINDDVQKSLFDQLIDRIVVDAETITVFLIVSPFPRYGDKIPQGQPHVAISPNITRAAFDEIY